MQCQTLLSTHPSVWQWQLIPTQERLWWVTTLQGPHSMSFLHVGTAPFRIRKSSSFHCHLQACGPTIPKDCLSLTMYNGVCLQLGQNNPVPPSLEGKSKQTDEMGWDRAYTYLQQSVNHKSWIMISEYHYLYFCRMPNPSRYCVSVGWFRQCESRRLSTNERICDKTGQFI